MSNRKKLSIEYANKIKYERGKELKDSLFADVYYEGCRLVRKILIENENLKSSIPDERFCTDEQFNNIIPFLGGRGMGKSSAVLSFALYLKEYEKCEDKLAVHTEKTTPEFYLLPRIDVAMMVRGENLLDIVLAKMWDEFEDKEKKKSQKDEIFEKTKEDFRKVKNSYGIYVNTVRGQEHAHNMTSVRELHELASCLNLRTDFQQLVKDYLCCIKRGDENSATEFLVVTIDDLDVAIQDAYEILEQIRLFLMIPKVIVLVTADINRLLLECNKHFSEKLIAKNTAKREKSQIREYADNYLSKILPGNRRIYMPDLNGLGGVEYEVDIKNYCERLGIQEGRESGSKEPLSLSEKKFLLVILERYTGIMFEPYGQRRHFLQQDSLRKIVNNLNMLAGIAEQEKGDWMHLACHWLFTELQEYSDNMKAIYCQNVARSIMRVDSEALNLNIIQKLDDFRVKESNFPFSAWRSLNQDDDYDNDNNDNDDYDDENGNDYGDVIKSLIQREDSRYEELMNFVSLLFAIQISIAKNDSEELQKYFRSNIFFASLKSVAGIREHVEIEKHWGDLTGLLSIPLQVKNNQLKSAGEIFRANMEDFFDIFKIANLCDINLWNEKAEGYKKFEIRDRSGENNQIDTLSQKVTRPEKVTRLEKARQTKAQQIRIQQTKAQQIRTQQTKAQQTKAQQIKAQQNEVQPIKGQQIKAQQNEMQQRIRITLESSSEGIVSMDNIFLNAVHFGKNWVGFCRNIYKALCSFTGELFAEEEFERLFAEKENNQRVEKWYTWRTNNGVQTVADILPIQSVEVICYLIRQMKEGREIGKIDKESDNITYMMLKWRLEYIVSELKNIDQYYMYEVAIPRGDAPQVSNQKGKKRYSYIIQEYVDEILQIKKLGNDFAARLDKGAQKGNSVEPVK